MINRWVLFKTYRLVYSGGMKLSAYLRPLDTTARTAFACAVGTTYLHLRNVAFSGKSCGVPLAVAIERETKGAVRRWDLRPADWHLIWPDLLEAADRPALPQEPQHAA